MTDGSDKHISVLLKEAVGYLQTDNGKYFIDGTLGAGGHSKAILESSESLSLMSIDLDHEAIEIARQRLSSYQDRMFIMRGNYSSMLDFAGELGWSSVDGILLDLGVSSMQIDSQSRGFSYRSEAALDMRMDQRQFKTASQILNGSSESELFRIFKDYGEEPRARQVARAIVKRREQRLWERTDELSDLIKQVAGQRTKRRVAEGRCFQALRIAVNDELQHLEKALVDGISLLAKGGRMVIISFHSLEDRIVKKRFKYESIDCICPPGLPVCRCDKEQTVKLITKKPFIPSDAEITDNKRASSAKMRVIEKV